MAQESPDLAGNRNDSGGLFGATVAEEEAEMEEGEVVDAGRLHHHNAASNTSNGQMGVGGDLIAFGPATQLQQTAQHQLQPTTAAGTQARATTATAAGQVQCSITAGAVQHHNGRTTSSQLKYRQR